MATYDKGVLGHFSGKVGTVIGSKWKGIHYMRSLPSKSKRQPTEIQMETRYRFALVTSFFKPINALIKTGFQSTSGDLTPVNAAVSYHLKNAIVGTSPDFEMDYSKLLFSRGELLGPKSAAVVGAANLSVNFTWVNNASEGNAKAEDTVSILLYCPIAKEYVVLQEAAERADLTLSLTVPASFEDNPTHCWLGNVSAGGKLVSTSVYLGTVTPTVD